MTRAIDGARWWIWWNSTQKRLIKGRVTAKRSIKCARSVNSSELLIKSESSASGTRGANRQLVRRLLSFYYFTEFQQRRPAKWLCLASCVCSLAVSLVAVHWNVVSSFAERDESADRVNQRRGQRPAGFRDVPKNISPANKAADGRRRRRAVGRVRAAYLAITRRPKRKKKPTELGCPSRWSGALSSTEPR